VLKGGETARVYGRQHQTDVTRRSVFWTILLFLAADWYIRLSFNL